MRPSLCYRPAPVQGTMALPESQMKVGHRDGTWCASTTNQHLTESDFLQEVLGSGVPTPTHFFLSCQWGSMFPVSPGLAETVLGEGLELTKTRTSIYLCEENDGSVTMFRPARSWPANSEGRVTLQAGLLSEGAESSAKCREGGCCYSN